MFFPSELNEQQRQDIVESTAQAIVECARENSQKPKAYFAKGLPEFNGIAVLYKLDVPAQHKDMQTEYLIVVCMPVYSNPRKRMALVFPSNDKGEVLDWQGFGSTVYEQSTPDSVMAWLGYNVV